jgi:7,8-dihydropterin-6-yl-methyl-4-(beta-D-ribofuranosyl)aminobenzene 5'-phosphate synthase
MSPDLPTPHIRNFNMNDLKRRDFLKASAAMAAASAAGGFGCVEIASAQPIQVPTVDKLTMRVLIDQAHDQFLRGSTVNGVVHEGPGPGRSADARNVLHNQWGLSLFLESERAQEQRTILLDFGYTAAALINNMGLLKTDPSKIHALIVSHGHVDHYGGLIGFLEKYRSVLPADLKLYAGGEDNFCHRLRGTTPGQLGENGTLDKRDVVAQKITTVLCETPTVIAGHAFTTGKIKRNSIERVLPNGFVDYTKETASCEYGHFTSAEMQGKMVPDEHVHEHATCFNIRGKGLVVISSCGHAGIVNSVRQAQEVSGIQKVHAIVGGFHLGPAPADYLKQVLAEVKKLEPDVLIPMHCSGLNFVLEARAQMPNNVISTSTGSKLTFSA